MKVLIALMVVASFWPCSVARADTIEFKNGNKIHGKAIVETAEVYGRKHLLLKPGKMRVIFKNGGWFEFDASTVKNVEANDLDEFEWRRAGHFIVPTKGGGTLEFIPGEVKLDPNVNGKVRLEVKTEVKIESTNP